MVNVCKCNFLEKLLSLFLLYIFALNTGASGEINIPDGVQIQPPIKFVWSRNNSDTRGMTEYIFELNSVAYPYSPSYQQALDPLRHSTCLEYGGAWLCHPITQYPYYPGYNGWVMGYRFCRSYEPDYCGWHTSAMSGICPGDSPGYSIKDIYNKIVMVI